MAEEEKKPEEEKQKQAQAPEDAGGTEAEAQAGPESPQANADQAAGETQQAAAGPEPSMPSPSEEPAGSSGKRMALIVAGVLILAVGAVVAGIISGQRARSAKRQEQESVAAVPTPASSEDALTEQYEQQSTSDEIADIEADLQATSFDGIDAELSDIDQELSAE